MIRFNTISLFGSKLEDNYEVVPQEVGPRVVDDSNFIPLSEAVKQLSKSQLSSGVIEGYYDFPDGSDDGRKVDVSRMRPEIVELSVNVRNKQEELRKQLKKAQKKAEDAQIMQSFKLNQTVKKE